MRENRFFFQGGVVLSFASANLVFSGIAWDFISTFSNKINASGASELRVLSAVMLAIAISPSLGYMIYALRHALFMANGGWANFYMKNDIKPLIDKLPDTISINDLDVKASWYFCNDVNEKEYVKWIRRRMDAYLISTAIILDIFITDTAFFLIINIFNIPYDTKGIMHVWAASLFFMLVLWYIASSELKKGVEGFKLFFAEATNSLEKQVGLKN